MRGLVIGSTAAVCALPEGYRTPKDLDVFGQHFPLPCDQYWHDSFTDWIPEGRLRWASLDELYTIKVSHSYWELKNGSWLKHVEDAALLKKAGAKLDMSLHKLLYSVWEERYGKKQMNLQQEADTFFADAVKRKYDHDSIHESVAYGDRPVYESVLKPGASVDIDMAAVKALDPDDQVKLYREEVYVTALERKIIPSDYTASPRAAYAWALKRTITSLTKGWSARFIVENYDRFRKPDSDYVGRHLEQAHKLKEL